MKNRRVEIAHVHRVLHDVVAEVVGFAVGVPRLTPPPAIHIVKHAGGDRGRSCRASDALAVDRASELAAPDDQRVIEQAALFQIGDQRIAGAIRLLALTGNTPTTSP